MKAITVRQPYAYAIATGRKLIENRTRPVSYRGELAIHAGAAWYRGAQDDPSVINFWREMFGTDRPDAADLASQGLWRNVLAVAELFDCHIPSPHCCPSRWADPDAGAHLGLRHVRRLDRPVPARGALQLWELPEEADRAVRRQVALGQVQLAYP